MFENYFCAEKDDMIFFIEKTELTIALFENLEPKDRIFDLKKIPPQHLDSEKYQQIKVIMMKNTKKISIYYSEFGLPDSEADCDHFEIDIQSFLLEFGSFLLPYLPVAVESGIDVSDINTWEKCNAFTILLGAIIDAPDQNQATILTDVFVNLIEVLNSQPGQKITRKDYAFDILVYEDCESTNCGEKFVDTFMHCGKKYTNLRSHFIRIYVCLLKFNVNFINPKDLKIPNVNETFVLTSSANNPDDIEQRTHYLIKFLN